MTVFEIERAEDHQKLHTHRKTLLSQPAIVFIVANWCGHCKALKDPIETLKKTMPNNVNTVIIHLSEFEKISNDPLINTLKNHGAGSSGVPYIGYSLPRNKEINLAEHRGKRSALEIAKGLLRVLKN